MGLEKFQTTLDRIKQILIIQQEQHQLEQEQREKELEDLDKVSDNFPDNLLINLSSYFNEQEQEILKKMYLRFDESLMKILKEAESTQNLSKVLHSLSELIKKQASPALKNYFQSLP
jgi:hypothetical protein